VTTVINASGCVVGRLASNIAERVLDGEEVRVVNSENAIVTGDKNEVLQRYRDKYHRGTQRKGPHYPRTPHRIVKRTVRGMVPHQEARGREAMKRLKCEIGVPREVDASDAVTPDEAEPRSEVENVTIKEISRDLGADV